MTDMNGTETGICPKCGEEFSPSSDSLTRCCERHRKQIEKAMRKTAKAKKAKAGTKKAPEKTKAKGGKPRPREEEKAVRILAAHEKRRLMGKESLRNRAVNAERYAAMRAASMEKAKIARSKRAAAQVAAAIEKSKAIEEETAAKALSDGGEIGYGVCKGCGRDFKFVVKPRKAVPEYCCNTCRWHANYVENRDKLIEYGKKYRDEKKSGGRKKSENLMTYYRGSGFYCRPAGEALSFSEDRALDAMMEQPFFEESFAQ